MKNTAGVGIGFVLFVSLAALPAGAQDQSPSNSQDSSSGSSLGDYARQVRKDPGAKAKPKVFDNDNLSKQDKLSIVGTPSASTSTTTNAGEAKETSASSAPATEPKTSEAKAGATEGATEATTPAGEKVPTGEKPAASAAAKAPEDEATKQAAWKQWTDKIGTQKQQTDLLARELDVLQREYQIRAAAMYADAGNRMRNSADWDKQDAQYKQQIADKQKALDEAKQKLEDIEEQARKAGAPTSVREQ